MLLLHPEQLVTIGSSRAEVLRIAALCGLFSFSLAFGVIALCTRGMLWRQGATKMNLLTVGAVVAVITGGAGDMVEKAADAGIDTFVTGEGPQWSWVRAEELGINVIYGGHYATETLGVQALAAHLAKKFRVPWKFVDHPVPL